MAELLGNPMKDFAGRRRRDRVKVLREAAKERAKDLPPPPERI